MKSNTIELLLGDLMQACLDAYATVDYAPAVPERRMILHGQPGPWQGEQLTVMCTAVKPVAPFPLAKQSAIKSAVVPAADLAIEVVRDVWPPPHVTSPGSSLPEPAAITAAALQLSADAATLFGYIANLAATGGLFPSIPEIGTAEEVAVGTMLPLGPQDRLAGWRWPINVKLAIL